MFDEAPAPRKKIAIIGAGISGLSAAYYLSEHHDVALYEAGPRLGGHARTVLAGKNGDQPVDTGFIVFNYATYPYLTALFKELNIPVMQSNMSFGASIDDGRIEYSLSSLRAASAQRRNLIRPQFYRMMMDILRFAKRTEGAKLDDNMTIGEFIDDLSMGNWFRDNYLMPMCGAIWSTPVEDIEKFPARSLIQFFKNHSLLSASRKHQWWTVNGGSIEYVKRLEAALRQRGVQVRLSSPVDHVARHAVGNVVRSNGTADDFDEVILACHSDQALTILGDGITEAEHRALSAIRYQTNSAILHCDPAQMPKRRACWASWSYRSQGGSIGVTYWMNQLQNIPMNDPLFVTLNPTREITEEMIFDQVEFAHPMFDKAALDAQAQISALQGQNHTWFAGAWNRHGFHEDGIASAMAVVERLVPARPVAIAAE